MRSIGAKQAQVHFHRLLAEVAAGEALGITRRGRPIARLIPIKSPNATTEERLEVIRALRIGLRLNGASIRELIDEGRR